MKNINFQNLFRQGKVVESNDIFIHFHSPETPLVYDSNEIQLKIMPDVSQFILIEEYLKDFQLKQRQKHLKFCFPENQIFSHHLIGYLSQADYGNGLLELYAIHPEQFPKKAESSEVRICLVDRHHLQTYLAFQYELDLKFGKDFAEQKQFLYHQSFNECSILQLLAFYHGIPAGSVDVILTEHTVELDHLIVLEPYRNNGIGSRLQQYVMDHYPDKMVILAADGYDTAKEMYKKQNYQYVGFRFEVLKVME